MNRLIVFEWNLGHIVVGVSLQSDADSFCQESAETLSGRSSQLNCYAVVWQPLFLVLPTHHLTKTKMQPRPYGKKRLYVFRKNGFFPHVFFILWTLFIFYLAKLLNSAIPTKLLQKSTLAMRNSLSIAITLRRCHAHQETNFTGVFFHMVWVILCICQ